MQFKNHISAAHYLLIILLNKTCRYHTRVFTTELIFCNHLKSNAKIPLTFCEGNQGDANFLVTQKDVIPSSLLVRHHRYLLGVGPVCAASFDLIQQKAHSCLPENVSLPIHPYASLCVCLHRALPEIQSVMVTCDTWRGILCYCQVRTGPVCRVAVQCWPGCQ